jgi:hypothetical protein
MSAPIAQVALVMRAAPLVRKGVHVLDADARRVVRPRTKVTLEELAFLAPAHLALWLVLVVDARAPPAAGLAR